MFLYNENNVLTKTIKYIDMDDAVEVDNINFMNFDLKLDRSEFKNLIKKYGTIKLFKISWQTETPLEQFILYEATKDECIDYLNSMLIANKLINKFIQSKE